MHFEVTDPDGREKMFKKNNVEYGPKVAETRQFLISFKRTELQRVGDAYSETSTQGVVC